MHDNKFQIRIRQSEGGSYQLIFFFGENGRVVKYYDDEGAAMRAAARCEAGSRNPRVMNVMKGLYQRGTEKLKWSDL